MAYDWYELQSLGRERQQRLLAEADEWRRALRAERARPAGPSAWRTLAAVVRRLAARPAPSLAARGAG
jgi:hypothetical protein